MSNRVLHPWRCETCATKDCYHHPQYFRKVSLWSLADHKKVWAFTSGYGCASHSNHSSEERELIRILDKICQKNVTDCTIEEIATLDRLYHWFKRREKHGGKE